MARLAFMLALCHAALLYALPTREMKRELEDVDKRAVDISTNIEVTTSYSSIIPSFVQSASITVSPSITGSILTGLPSHGFTRDPADGPTVTSPAGSLAPIESTLDPAPTNPAGSPDSNIFVAMASNAPPEQIPARNDHAVKKQHIDDEDVPIQTNKFYANFFLGSQSQPVWTHPYSLAWAKGHGETWGMAVTHVERSQLAWGEGDVPHYFIGPVGLQHIVFSAAELGEETSLTTEALTAFSVFANLAPSPGAKPVLSLPCVQGMGFVTALYDGAQPHINSGTFFRTLEYVERLNGITFKYRISLEDNSEWLLYATPVASLGAPPFKIKNSALIEGPTDFVGMIQVAKNPANTSGEQVYDSTAGAYAVNATISGSVNESAGSYTLAWGKDGVQNQTLVMFALPHHVEAFSEETKGGLTDIELVTTTKGYARAVVADQITMVEPDLPDTIGFAPWVPTTGGGGGGSSNTNLGPGALAAVNDAGALELNEKFDRQTRLDSMYFSGKGLAKFAGIIYTLQSMAKNTELAAAGLVKLKDAFNVFVNNTQPLPLVYDSVWHGIVSSGTYRTGDTGLDFGNTLYNDHHFHYGYFVWAAAVIGYLDPSWLDDNHGANKAWVNALVRDFANPSASDPYFPFQRSFDWFHGHSWAKGLFESGDGKDQESSSEDTFSTYAVKMWGRTIGDANMEARGNLQLAVQSRSVRNYFLLSSDNQVQPKQFLPNKVTGILFENKVDHTTYFGGNPEYIQGIHMIPMNPTSAYTRPKTFVHEEWETYFSNGRVDQVQGGWKGILYANLALIDPQTAYEYFSNPKFDIGELDGGASRTWYLAYSAAMMADDGARVAESPVVVGGPPVTEEGEWAPQEEQDPSTVEEEEEENVDTLEEDEEWDPQAEVSSENDDENEEESWTGEEDPEEEEEEDPDFSDVEGRDSDDEEWDPEFDFEPEDEDPSSEDAQDGNAWDWF